MKLWTTFCPSKISWEITTARTQGKEKSSNWLANKDIIDNSLDILKKAGISGIRLVIFPSEITTDGETFDWQSIDTMLELCKKHGMLVDLCIGPFQYPHYPGIYLPESIRGIKGIKGNLDDIADIREYGLLFLELQMERYAGDTRLRGFHFANEWPDRQAVSGNEATRVTVSKRFMIEAAKFLKKATRKPISLNTNIDVTSKNTLSRTFQEILAVLEEQGKLGFDIYPSQETWKKAPLQKMKRLIAKYPTSFGAACQTFAPCEIYFAEVEAQPWGGGQSWYALINAEDDPEEKVLSYTKNSLQETWDKHIADTPCQTVSLWGSDFWLTAYEMKIHWPLENISRLRNMSKAQMFSK